MATYSNDYNVVKNMFWDGKENAIIYCLDNNGIEHCLFRALKDYTARTEKKKEHDATASAITMLEVLKNHGFLRAFEEYFNANVRDQREYDEWHHELCNCFIEIITNSKIRSTVSYGKAQKIVNITMKTIYCLAGAKEKANQGYFDHCHMPLDSFTLEWFRKKLAEEWYNPSKPRVFKIKISTESGPLPKWSNLGFKKESLKTDFNTYDADIDSRTINNRYHYMFFVTMIREYFDSHKNSNNPYKGLTPFQAEFYIWPEIQWETSARNLVKQDLINRIAIIQSITTNNIEINKLCIDLKKQVEKILTIYRG